MEFNINTNRLETEIERVELQGNLIEGKISHFLKDSNLSQQKILEFCHIGKFLTLFDNQQTEIISQCESPDFIIAVDGVEIGLEHELILNNQRVQNIQSIKNLFNQAAKIFEKKYPNIKLLANCWINNDKLKIKKSEKDHLINQIVEYIYGLTINNIVPKPAFIDDIRIMKHSGVSFSYNSNISDVKNIDNSLVQKAIDKKELLVANYISNSNLQLQWLVLVIGQLSSDSYDLVGKDF